MSNCDIIYNGKTYKDDEFLHYLAQRGITEDILVRESNLIERAKRLSVGIKGIYKDAFNNDPRTALQEAAQQANSSAGEKRGAIAAFGKEIVDIAQKLFPQAKPGDVYLQKNSDVPKPASPATIAKFKEFNDRIGVSVQELQDIVVNGKKLNGVNAVALPYEGLIQIVNGKTSTALPEESMHVAVEILQQKNPTLFKELMADVNNHPEANQVFAEYSKNKLYMTPDGKPDVMKLKKEAAAKILAKIVGGIVDEGDNKAAIGKTRSLWQRIVDWLKSLFTKAKFDPFEEVAKQVTGEKEFVGTVSDLKASKAEFLQKNKDAVDYQLSGLKKLADNIGKIEKWEQQIKDPAILFKKIQADLGIPKNQLALVEERYRNSISSTRGFNIKDAIISTAADMTYTVEVNRGLKKEYEPSNYYEYLAVPGGINYQENDIRTPDISGLVTTSHAQFSTPNSIGWFRSDESIDEKLAIGIKDVADANTGFVGEVPVYKEGTSSKTRRVLEVQSDLFQKNRDKSYLVSKPRMNASLVTSAESQEEYDQLINDGWENIGTTDDGFPLFQKPDLRAQAGDLEESKDSQKNNQFLQLLNQDGAWIGYFAKVIMQDSFRKGFDSVRFPAGDTAAKVEGHQVIGDRIKRIDEELENKKPLAEFSDDQIRKYIAEKYIHDVEDGDFGPISSQLEDEIDRVLSKYIRGDYSDISQREVDRWRDRHKKDVRLLEEERANLKDNGLAKIAPITHFYEVRLKNTIDKIYGKTNVARVTDEHGNDWFEVAVNPIRDSEIFLQIASEEQLHDKIEKVAETIVRKGDEYTVNGEKVPNSVDEDIRKDLANKYRYHNKFQEALAAWRHEYRDKLQNEITNLANRYIDDSGLIRTTYNTNPLTSVIDPYDLSFAETLDTWLRAKIESYPAGTRFVINKPIYTSGGGKPEKAKAGFVDFVAIYTNAKGDKRIDLNQFKITTPRKTLLDIPQKIQDTYNLELEGLKDILMKSYDVKASDFWEIRSWPIRAEYGVVTDADRDLTQPFEHFYLKSLQIGNVDVKVEKDRTLLPIPARSETTGIDKLDTMIKQLKESAEILSRQPAAKGQEGAKKQRVADLFGAIRELQIQKSAENLIRSGDEVVKFEESKFTDLEKKVKNTDPLVAGEDGLEELLRELHASSARLAPYSSLGETMRQVYGPNDEAGNTEAGKKVSYTANNLITDMDRLEDYIRTNLFSQISGIKDEMKPEKKISWARRMFLGISHGSFKSQGQFWHLMERNSNFYRYEADEFLRKMQHIHKDLQASNITNEDLQKMILEKDDKGRWTGNTIQKIDASFARTIRDAINKQDIKKIRESIDLDKYKEWYDEHLAGAEEYVKNAVFTGTPEEQERDKRSFISHWKEVHDISKETAANRDNPGLYKFPKEGMWESEAYKTLKANPKVMAVYDALAKVIERADNAGMFDQKGDKYGFFPQAPKSWIERFNSPDGFHNTGVISPWKWMQTTPEDQRFGDYDPISGLPIKKVRANYVRDLGRRVKDTAGNYFTDYADVSQEVLKAIYLFGLDTIKFELKAGTEHLAKMLINTEARVPTLLNTRSKETGKRQVVNINVENLDAMRKYMDFEYYDEVIQNPDSTITIDVGRKAQFVNKVLGFRFMSVPETGTVTLSLNKFIAGLGRWFNNKTMAFSTLGPVSNLFGGSVNSFINSGKYFNRADLGRAYARIIDMPYWSSEEGKKMGALIHYFRPELNDSERAEARKFSSNKVERFATTDHLHILMRKTDEAVNNTAAIAMFNNTLLQNGELVLIVDKVRADNNWNQRYNLSTPEREALEQKVKSEIEDLKQNSPDLLIKQVKLDKDGHAVLPISREAYRDFRRILVQMNKEMLGNMSAEDLAQYRLSVWGGQAMMFKNWIPELLYKRTGALEYNYGAHAYTYGRFRGFVGHVVHHGLEGTTSLIKLLSGKKEDFIRLAKLEYERRKQKAIDNDEEFNLEEGNFIDLYMKAVTSGFKEIGLALGLLGVYFYLKSLSAEDKEKDHLKAGAYKFTLRAIDKLQDEISFFYKPTSFTSLFNGNVFPALSLATDAEKLFKNLAALSIAEIKGDDQAISKIHIMKYIYKDIPIAKEWMNYQALFSEKFAKEMGIVQQSQSGGGR